MHSVNFCFFVVASIICSSSAMPCDGLSGAEVLVNGGAAVGCTHEIILVTVSEEGDYMESLANPGVLHPVSTSKVDSPDLSLDTVVVESAVKEEVSQVTDLPTDPVSPANQNDCTTVVTPLAKAEDGNITLTESAKQ